MAIAPGVSWTTEQDPIIFGKGDKPIGRLSQLSPTGDTEQFTSTEPEKPQTSKPKAK